MPALHTALLPWVREEQHRMDPLQVPYTKGIRDTELKLEVVGQSEPRKRNSDEFRTKLSNGCIMIIS